MASGADIYRRAIRGAVRAWWKKLINVDEFAEMMWVAIESGLTRAWFTGAADCGIMPDELSMDEHVALAEAILREAEWIGGFASAIEESEKLTPMFKRSDIWIGRWEGVRSEARILACSDKKLEWVQGPSEEGCRDCSRLSGKVKRGSQWAASGYKPREHGGKISCQGYRCLCELVPTDKPMSKGPLPNA